MNTQTNISPEIQKILCCPRCKSDLKFDSTHYCCESETCASEYPIVDGIPILLDEQSSIFSIDDFVNNENTTYDLQRSSARRLLDKVSPEITRNVSCKENYELFSSVLLKHSANPRVLIVGGGVVGRDMEPLINNTNIELVETDVSFGPRTSLICDGHDLPFNDGSFDGVVVQAVLEHVADPYRCVEEIHRILNPSGLVYADTPFMQQGHMGPFDFTRFTHLGHRRLFRQFEEITSGIGCGPGTAFAWSYKYFLLSFSTKRLTRSLINQFANFTSFYFKYFDKHLNNKPGAYEAASSFFFIGVKSNSVLSDKELIKLFRGHG